MRNKQSRIERSSKWKYPPQKYLARTAEREEQELEVFYNLKLVFHWPARARVQNAP